MKYIGINLIKLVQDLYNEIHKMLMKSVKKNLESLRETI